MPCHVAIHGNEAVFLTSLPRCLKAVNLARLSPGFDTKDSVIKAKVVKRWPRQRTFLKLQLAQDDCVKRLNVFLKGTLSEECDLVEEGDVIAMSNVTVESNTRQSLETLPCQVMADPDQASVWLLKTKKSKHPPLSDPQPSTSDAPAVAHVDKLNAATPLSGSSVVASGQSTAVSRTFKAGRSKTSFVRSYTYTLLKDVQFGSVFNVFGVVKFFKEPTRTRGSDYRMVLSLVDASLDPGRKLKCLLFARNVSELPDVGSIGDIVRLHRLKIKNFNDELQGQCSAGFACLMFDGTVDGSLEPRTSDATFTLTDSDRDRVRELREWVHSDVSPPRLSQEGDDTVTLSDVAVGQYFNLTCQIVATCVTEPDVCMLLRAWDGTKVNGATYEEDTRLEELSERMTCDHPLVRRALGYIVDVFVFDDHFEAASHIKPGDFVTFHNLHAMRHRNAGEIVTTTPDIIPAIEFCLHRGSSFGRRLLVLPPGSDCAETLKSRLDSIVVTDSSRISEESGVLSGSWLMPLDLEGIDSASVVTCRENRNCSELKMEVETSRQKAQSDVESMRRSTPLRQGTSSEAVPNRSSTLGDARCMLRTATVITGHHHVAPTKLIDVVGHKVPYKFRVRCKMVDFHPNASTAEEFIHLYCPKCHFLSALVNGCSTQTTDDTETSEEAEWLSKAEVSRVRGKVKYYTCPQCLEAQEVLNRGTEGRVELEYIYMMRLLLRDETKELLVVLWRSEAMKFFHHIEPASLLANPCEYQRIKSLLVKLCVDNLSDSSVECCIQTFTTPRGVTYEMFDTAICLDD